LEVVIVITQVQGEDMQDSSELDEEVQEFIDQEEAEEGDW